jgi:hypothetical protein
VSDVLETQWHEREIDSFKINGNKNAIFANSVVEDAWNLMMKIPTRSSYHYAVEFGTLGFTVLPFHLNTTDNQVSVMNKAEFSRYFSYICFTVTSLVLLKQLVVVELADIL